MKGGSGKKNKIVRTNGVDREGDCGGVVVIF